MCPRGAPDYSNVRSADPLHRLDDMAELAARLGSIVTFDREGRVIHLDDFSSGISQWGTAAYGEGAWIRASALRCKSPAFSMELRTGQDDAHGAKATLEIAYHHLCNIGLEYAFTHTVDSEWHYFRLRHHEGATKYSYTIAFDIQNGRILVHHSAGTWHVVADGLNLKSDAFIFNVGKLVVDTVNNQYVRLIFNDETYLLSDYAPLAEEESSVPYLEIDIEIVGDLAANRIHYIDNVILTQNEPDNP